MKFVEFRYHDLFHLSFPISVCIFIIFILLSFVRGHLFKKGKEDFSICLRYSNLLTDTTLSLYICLIIASFMFSFIHSLIHPDKQCAYLVLSIVLSSVCMCVCVRWEKACKGSCCYLELSSPLETSSLSGIFPDGHLDTSRVSLGIQSAPCT